ncbi:hypothetical protein H1C71_020337, partial [Ictidomys tridecemlineatus]
AGSDCQHPPPPAPQPLGLPKLEDQARVRGPSFEGQRADIDASSPHTRWHSPRTSPYTSTPPSSGAAGPELLSFAILSAMMFCLTVVPELMEYTVYGLRPLKL